jgi:hypothetical protein
MAGNAWRSADPTEWRRTLWAIPHKRSAVGAAKLTAKQA